MPPEWNMTNSHETFDRPDDVKLGSEKSFGLVMAAAFGLIGAWQVWRGREWGWWALGLATAFLVLAFLAPRLLRPLNWLWFQFGLLLHKITNPLIMGLLFFVAVLPIGLLMRALGKRPLSLSYDPAAKSYWIERAPPGPSGESYKNQF